jgi:hypothetical protein
MSRGLLHLVVLVLLLTVANAQQPRRVRSPAPPRRPRPSPKSSNKPVELEPGATNQCQVSTWSECSTVVAGQNYGESAQFLLSHTAFA